MGNTRSDTDKKTISINANQKLGSACPITDRKSAIRSITLFGRIAAATPSGTDNTIANVIADTWLDEIESVPTSQAQSARLPRHEETKVYSLNVIARADQGFSGDDILRVLLGCGLRFGDMDFFHLSEVQGGVPTIQFSVANMMRPGVFDLENMDDLSTQGLMFFLTLPGPHDMARAFDLMLDTAHTVAHSLGGDVYDETRSVMTKQYVESLRQSIREYENKWRAETSQ